MLCVYRMVGVFIECACFLVFSRGMEHLNFQGCFKPWQMMATTGNLRGWKRQWFWIQLEILHIQLLPWRSLHHNFRSVYIYILYIYTLYIIYHIVRSLVSQLTVLTIGYSHQNHHPHHGYVSGSHCSEPEPATILAEAVPGTKPYGGPKPWPTAPAESNPADPAMVRMWSPTS